MIEILGIKYINEKEASHRYSYSKQWFRKNRYEKKGPPFVRLTERGRILYPLNETDVWFNINLK